MTHPKIDECRDKMRKAVVHLQDEFGSVRTGRATPALVEKLRVDYYGSEVPLQQLAGFSVPEPRVLVVAPYDKSAIKAIEKDEIGGVNYTLERIRLDRRKLDYRQKGDPARDFAPERQALDEREARQKAAYAEAEQKLVKQMESVGSSRVRVWPKTTRLPA